MSWYDQAKYVIRKTHEAMPEDISFADRKKAIHDAYPFGMREYHPYKMWCKAQREYLNAWNPDRGKIRPRQLPPDGLFGAKQT